MQPVTERTADAWRIALRPLVDRLCSSFQSWFAWNGGGAALCGRKQAPGVGSFAGWI